MALLHSRRIAWALRASAMHRLVGKGAEMPFMTSPWIAGRPGTPARPGGAKLFSLVLLIEQPTDPGQVLRCVDARAWFVMGNVHCDAVPMPHGTQLLQGFHALERRNCEAWKLAQKTSAIGVDADMAQRHKGWWSSPAVAPPDLLCGVAGKGNGRPAEVQCQVAGVDDDLDDVLAKVVFQQCNRVRSGADTGLGMQGKQRRYGLERFTAETRRLYGVMDRRLAEHDYFAGGLSIADFAIIGWVWRHARHQVDLADFPHVQRWYQALMARPAVARGFAVPLKRSAP